MGTFFYHPNHLGSVSMITDVDGNIVNRVYYKPYGEIIRSESSGPDIARYKYTGQEEDAETGLMYYGARYYDPALGRFITADTMVPDPEFSQSFDRYMYVAGNPIEYTDPTGNAPKWWGELKNWFKGEQKDFGNAMSTVGGGMVTWGVAGLLAPEVTGISKALGIALIIGGFTLIILGNYLVQTAPAGQQGSGNPNNEVRTEFGVSYGGGQVGLYYSNDYNQTTFWPGEEGNDSGGSGGATGGLAPSVVSSAVRGATFGLGIAIVSYYALPYLYSSAPYWGSISQGTQRIEQGSTLSLPLKSPSIRGRITKTISNINSGKLPFKRDGIIFKNREQILPRKSIGYYKEYTVPNPSLTTRGAERLVTGKGGEIYYTPDHYGNFVRIK